MSTYADKTKENKGKQVADTIVQKQSGQGAVQLADNRSEAIQMQKLQMIADSSSQVKKAAQLQEMANAGRLQAGMNIGREIIQAKMVGAHDVTFTPGYATWDQGGTRWHINWSLGEEGVYHVTNESTNPKKHYFFTLDAGTIGDAVAPKGMKGRKGTSFKFSALPDAVKTYITTNINSLQSA